jgi:hypothetical protein
MIAHGRHHGARANSRLLQELALALEGLLKTADVEDEESVGVGRRGSLGKKNLLLREQ